MNIKHKTSPCHIYIPVVKSVVRLYRYPRYK